ncbi:hypothetical protein BDW74DRAFT_160297 [Aspergillus multicolor]|uniref:uncharacterized protein n=1 Tax=Aspergillus multicolor TaxID=41759 RepID=UPI003CCD8823
MRHSELKLRLQEGCTVTQAVLSSVYRHFCFFAFFGVTSAPSPDQDHNIQRSIGMRMLHGEGESIQGRLPNPCGAIFPNQCFGLIFLKMWLTVRNCLLHCCRDGGTDPSCHISNVGPATEGRQHRQCGYGQVSRFSSKNKEYAAHGYGYPPRFEKPYLAAWEWSPALTI